MRSYYYDAVVNDKRLLPKLLSNVAQKINFKVLEHFYLFEDPPVEKGPHLDL